MGADLFEFAFAKDPRGTEAWDTYRRNILQHGGSRNEMEMLEAFLGRPTNPDALMKSLGVSGND
jgi:metallopeptidase MepB